MGLQAELIETKGHPIVFAQNPPRAGLPTLLIYGHYDVQPPEPLVSRIFSTVRADGTRRQPLRSGATDDKGQMFTHLKAAEAWLKGAGELP